MTIMGAAMMTSDEPVRARWEVVVYRDGEPLCDRVPVTDWEAATVLAPIVAGWLGGKVSVARAVVGERMGMVYDYDEDDDG